MIRTSDSEATALQLESATQETQANQSAKYPFRPMSWFFKKRDFVLLRDDRLFDSSKSPANLKRPISIGEQFRVWIHKLESVDGQLEFNWEFESKVLNPKASESKHLPQLFWIFLLKNLNFSLKSSSEMILLLLNDLRKESLRFPSSEKKSRRPIRRIRCISYVVIKKKPS